MKHCPSKRSHIHPSRPPQVCIETCARYEYAVHLSDKEWIKPAIVEGKCPNHVPRMRPGASGGNP